MGESERAVVWLLQAARHKTQHSQHVKFIPTPHPACNCTPPPHSPCTPTPGAPLRCPPCCWPPLPSSTACWLHAAGRWLMPVRRGGSAPHSRGMATGASGAPGPCIVSTTSLPPTSCGQLCPGRCGGRLVGVEGLWRGQHAPLPHHPSCPPTLPTPALTPAQLGKLLTLYFIVAFGSSMDIAAIQVGAGEGGGYAAGSGRMAACGAQVANPQPSCSAPARAGALSTRSCTLPCRRTPPATSTTTRS